jgi:hypothetical protein
MKLKIIKQNKNDIDALKLFIKACDDQQTEMFNRICDSMNVKTEEDKNTLFDYIYNDSHWMVEVE